MQIIMCANSTVQIQNIRKHIILACKAVYYNPLFFYYLVDIITSWSQL